MIIQNRAHDPLSIANRLQVSATAMQTMDQRRMVMLRRDDEKLSGNDTNIIGVLKVVLFVFGRQEVLDAVVIAYWRQSVSQSVNHAMIILHSVDMDRTSEPAYSMHVTEVPIFMTPLTPLPMGAWD